MLWTVTRVWPARQPVIQHRSGNRVLPLPNRATCHHPWCQPNDLTSGRSACRGRRVGERQVILCVSGCGARRRAPESSVITGDAPESAGIGWFPPVPLRANNVLVQAHMEQERGSPGSAFRKSVGRGFEAPPAPLQSPLHRAVQQIGGLTRTARMGSRFPRGVLRNVGRRMGGATGPREPPVDDESFAADFCGCLPLNLAVAGSRRRGYGAPAQTDPLPFIGGARRLPRCDV